MSDERYEVDITVDATQAIANTGKFVAETKKIDNAAKTATASLEKQAAATKKLANAQTAANKGGGGKGTRYADITQKQLDLYNSLIPEQEAYRKSVAKLGGQYGDDITKLQARAAAQKAEALAQKQATAQNLAAQRAQAAAQRAATAAQNKYYTSLSNTRYALYDASQAYIMLAGALAAPALAAVAFSVKYDKAFSSVRRTTLETGQPLAELRQGLVDLTTEMPTSFESIAQIATIGAQLNVATEDLKDFTAVVSMFSATTNTTVDAAAVGLGRLAQLTHTAGSDYENLGSAIYQVGITSVATEQEILNMASEIATSGDLAGFANHEIIALAGALSSLGVQPEAARGSLQRIFNVIEQGATNGGASLERLAKISGMTSQDFAKTWGSDAQAAFSAFVKGLDKIQDSGGNTIQTLKDIGIVNVRDSRTMQILANNTSVYNNALRESNDAYESGSALREGFAVQMANLADQLTILWQTLGAAADEVGQEFGPALNAIAGSAQKLAELLLTVVRTPIGGWLAAGTVAILAGAAAWFAFQGVMALVRAAIGSLITSTIGLKQNAGVLAGGLKELVLEFFNVSRAMNTAGVSSTAASNGMKRLASDTYVAKRALGDVTNGARVASGAVTGFKALLSTVGIGLALMAIPAAIDAIGYAFSSNADKARSFFGEFDSLDAAFKEDTEAWKKGEKAVHLVSGAFETATTTTSDFTSEIKAAAKGQDTWATKIETTTKKINEQTIALGKATKESFANELVSGDSGKELARILAENKDALKSTGFSLSTWMDRSLEGTGNAYISQFRSKIEELRTIATTNKNDPNSLQTANNLTALLGAMDRLGGASDVLNEKSKAAANSQDFLAEAGIKVGNASAAAAAGLDTEIGKLETVVSANTALIGSTLTVDKAITDLSTSIGTNGTVFDTYSANGQANLDALNTALETLAKDAGDDTAAFSANFIGMIETIQSSGTEIGGNLDFLMGILNDTFGKKWGVNVDTDLARKNIDLYIAKVLEALRANLALAQSSADTALRLGDWAAYNAAMIQASAATKQIGQVTAIQAQAATQASKGTSALTTAQKNQAASADKANKSSKNLTKTVRTMTDYMSDLKKVVSSAFDFRFGLDQAKRDLKDAQDDIRETIVTFQGYANSASLGDGTAAQIASMSTAYTAAADEIADAAQKILDAQASLMENKADRNVAQYQLGVAVQYGDELQASVLRAKIAKLDAENLKINRDLAGAQNDLATAQENSTASASEQMETLTEKWQDYILELINSGASSKTVATAMKNAKTDIQNLGTQMGLGATQVKKYVTAIDDVKKAIDKVPKKLTVSASTDPAKRAIDEFLASKSIASLKSGVDVPITATVNKDSLAKAVRGQKLMAEMALAFGMAAKAALGGNFAGAAKHMKDGAALKAKLDSGQYQQGGFTGHGAANEPAGIVHKGEFVVPKPMVNQSTGLPYADALGRIMRGYQSGGFVTAPPKAASASTSIVELSPTDRALLAAVGNMSIAVDGKVLATSVNKANKNSAIRGQG